MSCFLKSTRTRRRHAMNACRQEEGMDIVLLPRKLRELRKIGKYEHSTTSRRTRERLAKHGFKAAYGALFQAALYLCSIAHTIDQPVL
jgi:hypothetical protein